MTFVWEHTGNNAMARWNGPLKRSTCRNQVSNAALNTQVRAENAIDTAWKRYTLG